MADGPVLELQAAINAKLISDTTVTALFGTPPWLFQDVPTPATLPYMTFGNMTSTDDSDECVNALDVLLDIEIYTRVMGVEQAARIAAAVRRSLHHADLVLATARCVDIKYVTDRPSRDAEIPDKQTIVTFSAYIEETI